jgi:predicted nuclease of predicted toxin-antitoxin system
MGCDCWPARTFPGEVVEALRNRGHDVLWVRTDAPGSTDEQVIGRAASAHRTIITFDKNFGELAFRVERTVSEGIVLFRLRLRSPAWVAQRTVTVLESRGDWRGHFAVVEEARVRLTPLPIKQDSGS